MPARYVRGCDGDAMSLLGDVNVRLCRSFRCIAIVSVALAGSAVIAAALLGVADARSPVDALAGVEDEVEREYGANQITTAMLAGELASGKKLLLLDAREAGEYRVSRIPGALRIDPHASAESIQHLLGDRAIGRQVIVYCSVGVRSSIAVKRIEQPLLDRGALTVAHLRGGIFRWHNERRPLADATGIVDVVHPYNAFWKRYLKFRDRARYRPLPKGSQS